MQMPCWWWWKCKCCSFHWNNWIRNLCNYFIDWRAMRAEVQNWLWFV